MTEKFDSVSWYADWTIRELQIARDACLRMAEAQTLWDGPQVKHARRLCSTSARRCAAEVARRGGRW